MEVSPNDDVKENWKTWEPKTSILARFHTGVYYTYKINGWVSTLFRILSSDKVLSTI